MQYVFVIGSPRSGTTIVQQLLDSHPKISCTFEDRLLHIWHELDVNTSNTVSNELFFAHDVERHKLNLASGFSHAFHEDHYDRNPNATMIGNKLPAHLFYTDWLRNRFDCRFVVCERRFEDIVKSAMENIYKGFGEDDVKEALESYREYTEKLREEEDCFFVPLARLKNNTDDLLYELSKFLEVDNMFNASLVK